MEIVIGIGLFLLLLFVGSATFGIIGGTADQRSGTLIALQAYTALAFIASAFLILRSAGAQAWRKLGLARGLPGRINWHGLELPRPIAYGLGAILTYGFFSLVLGALIHPQQDDIPDNLGYDASTAGNVAIGFLIVLAAPLSEEIFFRGFMFAGIRSRAPLAVAAVISSLFWGALHYSGPDTWGAVVQLTGFGLILCWVYERTGSIRTTIVIHAINNAIAFTFLVS